jgi:hypothetical protein
MPNPTVITDSELAGLLKNVYANFREKVQNTVTPLVAQLSKAREGGPKNLRWGGNGVYWDVVLGRPAGGNFSNGGFFGKDTTATEKQAFTNVVRGYVRRQVDGLALVGTKSKEAAFQTLARKTMEELREASALMMQASFHGAGNGVLATVGTVTDTVTIIVSSPYGVSGAGQGSLLISVGDYIAVLDSTGATVRGRAQVSAIPTVSGANSTLTLDTSVGSMVAGDIVVKASASDTSFNAATNGLINITNRGGNYNSLHGLTAATYGIWNAIRMTAGTDTPDAAQPTESDIWDLIQRVAGFSGKDAMLRPQEFLLMTTPGVGKKLMESFIGQRRFDAKDTSKVIKGGYKAVEVCGLPLVMDYYVPAGTMYLIHIPSLALVDAKDWGFVEYEGAGPVRWLDGRDAFEMTYGYYGNLASLQRNSHGSITGYTDTVFYTHVTAQA